MASIGIDIGSTATKGVLWNGSGFEFYLTPTGWTPGESAAKAVAQVRRRGHILKNEDLHVTATGYGRNVFQADKRVTEITCHAAGAHYLAPEASTVLDIGGQDSKVITLGPDCRVTDFLMNDKCAAGTGRFLQNMAVHLGCSLQDFAAIPENTPFQPINNMCTVFAESEVIGLLAQGTAPADIAAGVYLSIARRMRGLAARIPLKGECTFTGGLATSPAFSGLLAAELGVPVNVPDDPQTVGALGAALVAAR